MRLLALAHGLWRGGAQEYTLELLKLLKVSDIDVNVVTCAAADRSFVSDIYELGIQPYLVPHEIVHGYPDMMVERLSELIRSSDIVWISDIEYLAAARLKRISGDIPVIAQLHSFALICPIWTKLFGMRELCTIRCSPLRITRCKQSCNHYLGNWKILNRNKAMIYALLDYGKGPADFARWPMRTMPLDRIDGFVTVSRFAKDVLLSDLSQLKHLPFEIVHNPLVVPEPIVRDSPNNTTKILYAGGSSMIKGPHVVLHAVRRLLQTGIKSLTVTMLGVRGDRWIEGLVRQLGIERHVELLPRLRREDTYKLMTESRLVLMPSICPEVGGRVPLEANKLGTPAIVSDRGCLPDLIVDGVTGLVTEPSVESLQAAIVHGLSTEWDRREIARIARTRFDPERACRDFTRFLERRA